MVSIQTSMNLSAYWPRCTHRGNGGARPFAWMVLCAMVASLCAGCAEMGGGAINVAYDHAGWLVGQKITRYVDLDAAQKAEFRTRFERVHAWHRSHELPLYAAVLDQAAERMTRRLRREDIAWMMREIDERRRAGAIQIADELSPALLTLTAQQRAQLADSLGRDNARFAKTHLLADKERSVKERTDWLVGHIERWVGDLTPSQRARVQATVVVTPDYPQARVTERRRRQVRFVQLLDQSRDERALRLPLIGLLANPRADAGEQYRSAIGRYENELIQMVLDLDRSLSAQQRTEAVSRLHHYAEQARAMAAKHT